MGDAKGVVKAAFGTAQPDRLVEGMERAALEAGGQLRRAFARWRDDVDHPAQGVSAIEAALRPAEHLDARDAGGETLAEVVGPVLAGVVDVDAVDDDLGMVGVGATDEH